MKTREFFLLLCGHPADLWAWQRHFITSSIHDSYWQYTDVTLCRQALYGNDIVCKVSHKFFYTEHYECLHQCQKSRKIAQAPAEWRGYFPGTGGRGPLVPLSMLVPVSRLTPLCLQADDTHAAFFTVNKQTKQILQLCRLQRLHAGANKQAISVKKRCHLRWLKFWHHSPGRAPKAWIVGCERHICKLSGVKPEGLGQHHELPQWGLGSPAIFSYIHYTDKIWANFSPRMRKHMAADHMQPYAYAVCQCRGQIRDTKPKTGQIGTPRELWFFPAHVKNQEWMVILMPLQSCSSFAHRSSKLFTFRLTSRSATKILLTATTLTLW